MNQTPWSLRNLHRTLKSSAKIATARCSFRGGQIMEYQDQVEQSLLFAISEAPTDPTPRLSYADFLEDQLDSRSEYLRRSCQLWSLPPGDSACDIVRARLGELALEIPSHWRAEVADGYPEHCPACRPDDARGFKHCPQPWLSLVPTHASEHRVCHACTNRVVYCGSVPEVRTAVAAKNPVVLDPAIIRSNGVVPEIAFDQRVAEFALRRSQGEAVATNFLATLEEKATRDAPRPSLVAWIKSWFSMEPE